MSVSLVCWQSYICSSFGFELSVFQVSLVCFKLYICSSCGLAWLRISIEGKLLKSKLIWTSSRENLSSVVCEQQRRRLVCASAQSDQHLCYSLIVKYHIHTRYKRNFNFLASLCSGAGWFESRFFGNPKDRFTLGEAHIYS